MKRLAPALSLLAVSIARPQIKSGTAIFMDLAKDEFTFAADSRMTFSAGVHDDTECKILAFGNQFVVAMAGVVKATNWDAHVVARRVWNAEVVREPDPVKLVPIVAHKWAIEMEAIFNQPDVVNGLRQIHGEGSTEMDSGVLANAFFAATNNAGEITAYATNMIFDPSIFTSENPMRVSHDGKVLTSGSVSAGRDEIIGEFLNHTSARAKEYWQSVGPQIANLSPSQRHASIATKLIERSILLHPNANELAFPIDVLQLRRKSGVVWVSVKPNCQKE